MKTFALISVLVCLTGSVAFAQGETAAMQNGAWFELNYSHRSFLVEDNFAFPTAQGGFFAGYKLGPVAVGLGIELLRLSSDQDFGDFQDEESVARLMFMPGVRYAFLGSPDGRVELFGQLDFGFGKILLSDQDNPDLPEPTRFAYQVGPGVRYWVHPQFGFGAMVGLRGEFVTVEDEVNNFSATTTTTSITTNFQLTGLF